MNKILTAPTQEGAPLTSTTDLATIESDVAVDELISVLQEDQPALLEQLRVEFPEEKEWLRPGATLGTGHNAGASTRRRAKAAVAGAAIDSLDARCEYGLRRGRAKLAASSRYLAISQIANGLASLGLIGLLSTQSVAHIVCAVAAAVGSLGALVSQILLRNEQQEDNGHLKDYVTLVETFSKLHQLRLRFDIWKAGGYDTAGLPLLEELQSIALIVVKLVPFTDPNA